MLCRFLLIVLFAACSTARLENGLKKLASIRRGVENFVMDMDATGQKQQDGWEQRKQESLDAVRKLSSALLLRGTPMDSFRPQQMLPLFGIAQQKLTNPERQVKLKDYSISKCSSSSPDKFKFVINRLDISPQPVIIPGAVNFSFDISILSEIKNLHIDLDISVKVGSRMIKLPCINQFGSCPYDVCTLLKNVQCPEELEKHGINCKCPYKEGSYHEPGIVAQIGMSFPSGTYNATAMMLDDGEFVGCYTALLTIQD